MRHIQGMEVTLDGATIQYEGSTLASVMKSAVAAAANVGRIVVDIRADGERLPNEVLEHPDRPLSGVRVLAFTSADPQALVAQTCQEAANTLREIVEVQQEVAGRIQGGQIEEAMDPLRKVLETWGVVNQVVSEGTALLGISVDELRVRGFDGDATVQEALTELRDVLRSLRDAMESEDWSAIADAVGYDLDAQAKRWERLLEALAVHIGGGG
jgi:hypothetical protein